MEMYDLPRSTLQDIMNACQKLIKYTDSCDYTSGQASRGGHRKVMATLKSKELDKSVLIWLCQQHGSRAKVPATKMKKAAVKFSHNLGITNFKAFDGWFHGFKPHHSHTKCAEHGEALDALQ